MASLLSPFHGSFLFQACTDRSYQKMASEPVIACLDHTLLPASRRRPSCARHSTALEVRACMLSPVRSASALKSYGQRTSDPQVLPQTAPGVERDADLTGDIANTALHKIGVAKLGCDNDRWRWSRDLHVRRHRPIARATASCQHPTTGMLTPSTQTEIAGDRLSDQQRDPAHVTRSPHSNNQRPE